MKQVRSSIATVLVRVKPPPSSTIYSSKIAGRLTDFGSLLEFKASDSRHAEEISGKTYRAGFRSSEIAQAAVAASPITVQAYHNLPSPKSLDPFNVFGFQQRVQPEAQTFTCDLKLAGADVQQEKKPARTLITDERGAPLYRGLLEAEAPMNLLEGLSATIETEHMPEHRGFRRLPLEEPKEVLDLDNMYRKRQNEVRAWEDLPRVHKYLTGRLHPWKPILPRAPGGKEVAHKEQQGNQSEDKLGLGADK